MVSDCQHPGTPYILLHPPQILSLLTWSLQAPFSVSWGDLECRIALEDIGAALLLSSPQKLWGLVTAVHVELGICSCLLRTLAYACPQVK